MTAGFEALLVKRNIFQAWIKNVFRRRERGRSMRGACFLGKPSRFIFFFNLPYEFRLTLDITGRGKDPTSFLLDLTCILANNKIS